MGDLVESRLADVREVGALREVLLEEALGVLVAATLPRCVRITDVDLHARRHCEHHVFCEFPATVLGEAAPEVLGKALELADSNGCEFVPGTTDG